MIDKSAILVGDGTQTDPISGCPMYRKYITFEGNRENEFIKIFYLEWLQFPSGQNSEVKSKSYLVVDVQTATHVDENGNTIIDTPANTSFTDWFSSPIVAKADGLYIAGNMTAPPD